MKKIIISLGTLLMSLNFMAPTTMAATETERSSDSVDTQTKLIHRLNEIHNMDKSALSLDEKKALRKEAIASERQLRRIGGGIYISAGAVILILILVLIFL